jgi:serpin B
MRTALLLLPFLAAQGAEPPATAINRFAGGFYQQFARGSDNLVLSPYSNAAALFMLLEGARGQTATQLARALHQTSPDRASLTSLIDSLKRTANSDGSELSTAEGLFIQRGFHIRSDFEGVLTSSFHAALTQYDFAGNPEEARKGINSWTSQQTKGKIPDLFASGSLPNDVRMVLTSAIYFHGLWEHPFSPTNTRPAPFHTDARDTVNVETMSQTAEFAYAETPSLQVLEMKYGKSAVVFDILLPKTAEALGAAESSLNPETLAALWSRLSPREVAISLPRFRMETDISLRDALCRLGMTDAFSGAADFSGIDDKRDLVLSDMRHKAFLEVGEQGTTAAAVTGMAVKLISSAPPPTVFRADHPFLFLIRDSRTGLILFNGRLMKPR